MVISSLRTIADVRDAVEAYYFVVTKDPVPGSYYNIGGTETLKVGEVLEYLISLSTCHQITYKVDEKRLRQLMPTCKFQIPNSLLRQVGNLNIVLKRLFLVA